jgi:hypothetical protein
MTDDEAAVYGFCIQLHRTRKVDEATFNRAQALLGEQGVVDLIGVSGYYTAVSMNLEYVCSFCCAAKCRLVAPSDGLPRVPNSVAIRRTADMPRTRRARRSDAFDPQRKLATRFWCNAARAGYYSSWGDGRV